MRKDWRIDIACLGLRMALGLVLLYFGLQKVFGLFGGPGYAATVDQMGTMHIHPLLANISIIIESLGSFLLVIGLLTPAAAAAIAGNMAVAMFFNLKAPGALDSLRTGTPPGASMGLFITILMTVMALSIAAMGGGAYSLDARLFRNVKKK